MRGSSHGSFAQLCEQEAQIAKDRECLGGQLNTNAGAFSMLISRHRLVWLLLFGVVFIGLDQWSKNWAQENLAMRVMVADSAVVDGQIQSKPGFRYDANREIVVIPNVVSLIYRENEAAAFNITRSLPEWFRKPLLVSISTLATIFFLIWYFRLRENDALLLTSFCFIIAGAIGNLIDRATLGYVIDFLDVHGGFLGSNYHWPTFNVADSCIVMGAIGVLLRTIFHRKAA